MIRATTPTVILTLPTTVDLMTAQEVYVTFSQAAPSIFTPAVKNSITKTLGPDVQLHDGHTIYAYLNQAETLKFNAEADVGVQVNWITSGGDREATLIAYFRLSENLLPEVLPT